MSGPGGVRPLDAQQPGGPPANRPPGPPAKRPAGPPAKRPPGPPRKRPPGYPAKRPPGAPAKRPPGPPPGRRGPPPARPAQEPEYKSTKSKTSPPVIVFAVAFVIILIGVARTILIGPPPMPPEIVWFPLPTFQNVLVVTFLIWPLAAFWGAKRKKVPVVWVTTIAYLVVTFFFGYLQLLVFGGIPLLVGAFWLMAR